MRAQPIPCKACGGTGQRDLTDVETNTIEAVGSNWSTTVQILTRLRRIQGYVITHPALCNRLVDLLSLGLVERRPLNGKRYEWRRAP